MKSPLSFWRHSRTAALAVALLAAGCESQTVRFGGNADGGAGVDVVEGDARACDNALALCRGNCVDLASDPNNCGRCENACGAGYVCISGVCDVDCPKGQTRCGNTCANLMTSSANCGASRSAN